MTGFDAFAYETPDDAEACYLLCLRYGLNVTAAVDSVNNLPDAQVLDTDALTRNLPEVSVNILKTRQVRDIGQPNR